LEYNSGDFDLVLAASAPRFTALVAAIFVVKEEEGEVAAASLSAVP